MPFGQIIHYSFDSMPKLLFRSSCLLCPERSVTGCVGTLRHTALLACDSLIACVTEAIALSAGAIALSAGAIEPCICCRK